ncbi:small ribosomal subunit protein uS2m-like [Saccostrea echinata]|uniref:small ribosomal subunit protein uS2m-like n=1 Tax=Saccostrea echinata TaxID=191078 RepID=UPI002A82C3B6|nr:small ribosomal subunit protein uS2m-like [Saccostrea echinata]
MASGCTKKVDTILVMFNRIKKAKSLAGAYIPHLCPQRKYKTDTKAKVVLPRPLRIERIYEEKVFKNQTEKPLAKEVELVDYKPMENEYKRLLGDTFEDNALQHPDFFQVKEMVDMQTLYRNRVHYGHHFGCRHPYMVSFLYGLRHNTDIFDLDRTLPRLHLALNFIAHVVYRGGIVLFVSRNAQHMPLVEKTARNAGEYSHCRFWKSGLLTNIDRLFSNLTRHPDVVIFLHTQNSIGSDHIAVTECAKMLIPTVGVVDSNCNPTFITYPIPGNDDSPDAVKLYCKLFEQTILRAKEHRKRDVQK